MTKRLRWGLTAKLCIAVASILLINLILVWAFGNIFLEDYYEEHIRGQLSGGFGSLLGDYVTYDQTTAFNGLSRVEEKNIRVTLYALLSPESLNNHSVVGEEYYRLYGGVIGETQYLFLSEIRAVMSGIEGRLRPQSDTEYIRLLVLALGGESSAFVDDGGRAGFRPNPAASNQLALFGRLDDYTYALLETPFESISESAALATRFSTLAGLIALLVGLAVAVGFSMLFVRPIKQMTAAAGQMAGLDFSRRVNERGKDELGELGRSINAMSDALKDYTEELNSANEQLKKDIQERAKAELAQKTLVSNISHELKTPISIISGYAEGLKLGLAEDGRVRDEYCDVILQESRAMTHMLQSLLRLAKLQSGRDSPEYTDVDFVELIEKLMSALSLETQKKNLTVQTVFHTWRLARADRDSCEQVLRNYVTNALRHVPEGGVLRVTLRESGERVRLEVYNSGSRIDEDKLENIWSSFYRGDTARGREGGEVGLGLAIVKAHMLMHGMPYGCENTQDGVVFHAEFAAAMAVYS
jgi:signal transduction histidine kinase